MVGTTAALIAGVVIAGGAAARAATSRNSAGAPDYAAASREGVMADVETYPLKRMVDAAAKAGTQGTYKDAATGEEKVHDVTGVGHIDLSKIQLDYSLESADKIAKASLDLESKYGEQAIRQRLKELELSDPEGFMLRKRMGQDIMSDLEQGKELDDETREQVTEAERAAQALRGNVMGASSGAAEGLGRRRGGLAPLPEAPGKCLRLPVGDHAREPVQPDFRRSAGSGCLHPASHDAGHRHQSQRRGARCHLRPRCNRREPNCASLQQCPVADLPGITGRRRDGSLKRGGRKGTGIWRTPLLMPSKPARPPPSAPSNRANGKRSRKRSTRTRSSTGSLKGGARLPRPRASRSRIASRRTSSSVTQSPREPSRNSRRPSSQSTGVPRMPHGSTCPSNRPTPPTCICTPRSPKSSMLSTAPSTTTR